jgi:hypothetical protein
MELKEALDNLKNGGLPLTRKEAAGALGKAGESSEEIVLELLIAMDDPDAGVREAAETALENPVHAKALEAGPALRDRAKALVAERIATKKKEAAKDEVKARAKSGFLSWGLWAAISGIVALILPRFGYQLLLFRFIPITHPIAAISLILIGGALITVHFTRKG